MATAAARTIIMYHLSILQRPVLAAPHLDDESANWKRCHMSPYMKFIDSQIDVIRNLHDEFLSSSYTQ